MKESIYYLACDRVELDQILQQVPTVLVDEWFERSIIGRCELNVRMLTSAVDTFIEVCETLGIDPELVG